MNNFFKGFEGQHGAVKLWSEYQQSIIAGLPEAPEDLDNAVAAFVVRLNEKNEDVNYLLNTQAPIDARNVDRAYRRLALKLHPDRCGGSEYHAELFKCLSEAYIRAKKPFE
jgi:hypothetical protein